MRCLVLRLRQGCDIGAVMLSLRFIKEKLKSEQGVFNLFLCSWLKILTLKINTLAINLQISEKYL